MTLTDAIYAYNTGELIRYSSRELNQVSDLVLTKITQLNQVMRSENVAPELKEDLRKYEAIADDIARIMEKRSDPATII